MGKFWDAVFVVGLVLIFVAGGVWLAHRVDWQLRTVQRYRV